MATLLLKRGSRLIQTTYMIFPNGGFSELANLGLKVLGKAMGPVTGTLMEVAGKGQWLVHKALVGGSSVAGVLRLYEDHLEFEPFIPKPLAFLYSGIEAVSLQYDQILSVNSKKVRVIFNVVDLQLPNGNCRLQDFFASGAQQIAGVIQTQLEARRS